MFVSELIDKLKQMSPELRVHVGSASRDTCRPLCDVVVMYDSGMDYTYDLTEDPDEKHPDPIAVLDY